MRVADESMNELLPAEISTTHVLAGTLLLLLGLWLFYRSRRRRSRNLQDVIRAIGFDYLSNLVIPNADEGEIQIDHLILTSEGLLVVDVKDVTGIVFGSDKMQDWTVISRNRRFTFGNPQPALYDRIAAVRQIVRQVPVTGRILFLDGAQFTKGVPSLVCSLDQLVAEFGERDKAAAAKKIEAFKPHWEQLLRRAEEGEAPKSGRQTPTL